MASFRVVVGPGGWTRRVVGGVGCIRRVVPGRSILPVLAAIALDATWARRQVRRSSDGDALDESGAGEERPTVRPAR